MPGRAKRFYLCNLIPLWEIDEEDMDVDWPVGASYFGDLVEMRADIKKRAIKWHRDADETQPAADLKIRFEVYESDFLLSGGLNDDMGTFTSVSGFGDDDGHVRPLKIVSNFDAVPEADREKFIFIRWLDEEDVTVTGPDGTSSTQHRPKTLEVRCWWKVTEPEGGDVSGNPEYYYDVYVEGKLENGDDVDLHERSDHELVGFEWHVTNNVRKGRVTGLVDGEYAYVTMLDLIDRAEHSIHVCNWKMDPQAPLVIEHEFRADYAQIPGMTPAKFEQLLIRSKPRPLGVDAKGGVLFYSASNGNVVVANSSGIAPAVRSYDEPTNLDLPAGVHVLDVVDFPAAPLSSGGTIPAAPGVVTQALVVDQLRSRLLLYLVVPRAAIVGPVEPGVSLIVVASPAAGRPAQALPFFELMPTQPGVMQRDPEVVAGLVPLAGDGNPGGWVDKGMALAGLSDQVALRVPQGKLNRPTDVLVADNTIFVSDTGNHCIRMIESFDPAALDTALRDNAFVLKTFAGEAVPGDLDASGSAARFRSPTGLAWDSIGSRLLVADGGNHKLRAINRTTRAVTTLAVTKIDGAAGSLSEVHGLAFDATRGPKGTLYVSERDRNRVLAVDLNTLEAKTLAGSKSGASGYNDGGADGARFSVPLGICFDSDTVFVADAGNRLTRAIDVGAGTVSTIGRRPGDPCGPEHVPVVVADQLRRKAIAGVDVRILLDGAGSGISRDGIGHGGLISIDGPTTAADLHFYHPGIQAFVQDHVERIEKGLFASERKALATFHEKMIVVDGKHGITGGIDFAPDKNDGLAHERKHRSSIFWHDVAALVEGKAALGLDEHFVRRWMLLRDELLKQDEERADDEPTGSIFGASAHFRLPFRHYASQQLVLDASGSSGGAFRDIVEYRWEIYRRYARGDSHEDVLVGRTTVTTPTVRLERLLEAGDHKIKLTVRSSSGSEDSEERMLDVLPAPPDAITPVDRTDPSIQEHDIESVRTWDPSPVFISIGDSEVNEILDSYERAILSARHYVYMEHQYIYYPKIGDFIEEAMKSNPRLQVIWTIPFFTEESQDAYQERAIHLQRKALATSVLDTAEIGRAGGVYGAMRTQLAWHGFFRQHQMVEKFRAVDATRFGVFSVQRMFPSKELNRLKMEMIYPHSKMIMCDDRFMSIGSANANGRGFVTDGEHNVSSLAAGPAKALRDRLWGEHLSYLGLALTAQDPGSGEVWLVPISGHHLAVGDKVRLSHPALAGGEEERVVDAVDTDSGAIKVSGAALDPALRVVYWKDPRMSELRPQDALRFWRSAVHPLATYRKLKGLHGRTNAAGELVVPGNIAAAGDVVFFAGRLIELNEEGHGSSDPTYKPSVEGEMEVLSVAGEAIRVKPIEREVPDGPPLSTIPSGGTKEERPFLIRVVARAGGKVKIKVELMPNLTDVPFDYMVSWLQRQPGAQRNVRAWEIDTPPGIEYAGPGSTLFSWWFVIPRLLVNFDPDEMARLEIAPREVAFA